MNKKYAGGHRTYSVQGSLNGDDVSVTVYMPHTKCKNVKKISKDKYDTSGPCYLGDINLESTMPYLNVMDSSIYLGHNYFSGLLYKWNYEKSGFIFTYLSPKQKSKIPAKPGQQQQGIKLPTTSSAIPDKLSTGLLFESGSLVSGGNVTYIPILTAEYVSIFDFSAEFIRLLDNYVSQENFENMKLECSLHNVYNSNDHSACITISDRDYNVYYFDSIWKKTKEIKQFV